MFQTLSKLYQRFSVLIHFYLLLGYLVLMQFFVLHWKVTEKYLATTLPEWIAFFCAKFLSVIGYQSIASGTLVSIEDRFRFTIVYHCTGVLGMIIFVSAVVAFPATIREKLVGVAIGIPVLNVVNILRVSLLGVVGLYSHEVFEFCHHFLLQGVFIAFVIATWLVWRVKFVRSESSTLVPH